MRTVKRIEKVWVITWPKGTTEEWKGSAAPTPKDFQSLDAEPGIEFKFELYESGKWRNVIGSPKAVFSTRREALAYMRTGDYEGCFILRPAYLSIF